MADTTYALPGSVVDNFGPFSDQASSALDANIIAAIADPIGARNDSTYDYWNDSVHAAKLTWLFGPSSIQFSRVDSIVLHTWLRGHGGGPLNRAIHLLVGVAEADTPIDLPWDATVRDYPITLSTNPDTTVAWNQDLLNFGGLRFAISVEGTEDGGSGVFCTASYVEIIGARRSPSAYTFMV